MKKPTVNVKQQAIDYIQSMYDRIDDLINALFDGGFIHPKALHELTDSECEEECGRYLDVSSMITEELVGIQLAAEMILGGESYQ